MVTDILIVDDERDIRSLIGMTLEDEAMRQNRHLMPPKRGICCCQNPKIGHFGYLDA